MYIPKKNYKELPNKDNTAVNERMIVTILKNY